MFLWVILDLEKSDHHVLNIQVPQIRLDLLDRDLDLLFLLKQVDYFVEEIDDFIDPFNIHVHVFLTSI